MLGLWQSGTTDPGSILIFMIGAGLFFIALIVTRAGAPKGGAGDMRSGRSMIGVAVQCVGIGMVGGPVHVRGALFALDAAPRMFAVAAAMTAAVGLFVWSIRTMGRNWAIVARTRSDHQLVTSGPFAYVRNPIYVGMACFMLGLAFATGHERALIVAVPVFIIGTLIRTTEEERLLRAHFGAAYDDYAARVKRFLPGVV